METDQIICGDSAVVLKTFPDSYIDMSLQSPPYDHLRAGAYQSDFDFETIARQLYRITKPGGVCVWVVGDATVNGSETGTSFRQALFFMQIGWRLHDTMIYATNKPPINDKRYQPCFEFMFVFSRGTIKTFNPVLEKVSEYPATVERRNYKSNAAYHRTAKGKYVISKERSFNTGQRRRNNIWWIQSAFGANDEIASAHPAVFPEALARDHILSWSNPGDLVLDCFMGSGTVGKMCVLTDRKYIGIEISQEYVDLAHKRIAAARLQPKLFSFEIQYSSAGQLDKSDLNEQLDLLPVTSLP